MKFYSNGKYAGDYSGDMDLDKYNCYMYMLEQPDLCLFRFSRYPPIYRGVFHNKNLDKIYNTSLSEIINKPL